ncbi:ADP-L-glycero-D-manno-heptose-6-epimerase [Azospirillaceae bacterium]
MIIVTGGAGFIGSNLVAGLEARGLTDIVVCDRLGSEDKWRNVARRELAAIIPPERLFEFLNDYRADIEIIYHMGAISTTTETDVDRIIANNITLSLDILRWCTRAGVRLIYASSAATYGDGSAGFDDESSIEALARLRPLNPYGWSKHLFDRRVARLVYEEDRLPPQWVGLKFFNVYGPNEYHKGEQASVASKLYPQIIMGEPARLFRSHRPDYEDGGQLRDFVWVGDCVDVMLWLYNCRFVNGVFNIGTGEARSFKSLALATFGAAGLTSNIVYVDMPEDLRDKYQYYTQANINRLRTAGYKKPFTSLEEGIRLYVQNYMATLDPYL